LKEVGKTGVCNCATLVLDPGRGDEAFRKETLEKKIDVQA